MKEKDPHEPRKYFCVLFLVDKYRKKKIEEMSQIGL
jgi:hypothetical protein